MTLQELLGDKYQDGLTVDQITEALSSVNLPVDQTDEVRRLKESVTRANGEAAKYKRELADATKGKIDESAHNAQIEDLTKKLADMERKSHIAEYKARFVSQGYEAVLAEETATAMVDQDMEKVFENQAKFLQAHDLKVAADSMRNNPQPQNGGANGNNPKRDFNKEISDAKSSGNLAYAAYLMRISQEETANDTK